MENQTDKPVSQPTEANINQTNTCDNDGEELLNTKAGTRTLALPFSFLMSLRNSLH